MKSWIDKPITWRSYFKLCAVGSVVGAIYGAAYYVALTEPKWWMNVKSKLAR